MEQYISASSETLMYRYRKFLENMGIADSFQYIKGLDTIELTGTSANGKERVLINEVYRKYGMGFVKNNPGYHYYLPCFNEGVIKSKTSHGVTYYTHFVVGEATDTHFNISIREYHFLSGTFYLRYIIELGNIPKYAQEEDDNMEIDISYACAEQFFFNGIQETVLLKEFSKDDLNSLRYYAKKDDESIAESVETVIRYTLTTFRAINFLTNMRAQMKRDGEALALSHKAKVVVGSISDGRPENSVRKVDMQELYTVKPRKKLLSKEDSGESRVIHRKTNAWMVGGHTRTYKSGKVIYIEPYPKGPKREELATSKAIVKIVGPSK